MLRRCRRLAFIALAAVVAACGGTDMTSPLLDGPWSTGLLVIGLGMAVDLRWTPNAVHGNGSYAAAESGAPCGPDIVTGAGNLSFMAARVGNRLVGTITFANGTRLGYKGTLEGTSSIDGAFVARDGTECGVTFFRGLVP